MAGNKNKKKKVDRLATMVRLLYRSLRVHMYVDKHGHKPSNETRKSIAKTAIDLFPDEAQSLIRLKRSM